MKGTYYAQRPLAKIYRYEKENLSTNQNNRAGKM